MKALTIWLSILWACWWSARCVADAADIIDRQIAAHAGQTGVYVLEKGEEALLARAWLADHAEHSIEVQYFIWSTDNIGILAADAVLRAADRGVQVHIIVDDLLVDAPDKSLLALAQHPNIDIRIYNPTKSVGVPTHKRVINAARDFHGFNQRMHDKTFIVDGRVAITGGRNMAAEYYDYSHEYNFRDRDALLLGAAVQTMRVNFTEFWNSDYAVRVTDLYGGLGVTKKNVRVDKAEIQNVYRELHEYANSPANFTAEIRAAIAAAPAAFERIANDMVWGKVDFISDRPGKDAVRATAEPEADAITAVLAQLVNAARNRIVIQSPYLVLTDETLAMFRKARARGVRIRVNTNSLASTDNLPAFGGYQSQRQQLLDMGLEIFEYRPDAQAQRLLRDQELIGRAGGLAERASGKAPIFGLHAKTLVVDGATVFIGTFNLDPRSQNLNTEVGAVIHSERVARAVEAAIEVDMRAENSWNAATDNPDQYVSWFKRAKARAWRFMPIKPLL